MAVATGLALASTAVGLFQTGKGIADAKKTQAEIDAFTPLELENYNRNIQISTLKSDQQTDANLSNVATSIDALQRGGTRAVLGGVPKITESNILLQNLISQDLQNQDLRRQELIAKGDMDIQNIKEGRDMNILGGLGQKLQTSRQDAMSGFTNAISSGLSLSGMGGEDSLSKNGAYSNTFKGGAKVDTNVNIPEYSPSSAYGKKSIFN